MPAVVCEPVNGDDVFIEFTRAAVTPEQIARWNLPTRPTKASDSRARSPPESFFTWTIAFSPENVSVGRFVRIRVGETTAG